MLKKYFTILLFFYLLVEEEHGSQFKQTGDSCTQKFCGIYLLKSDPVTLEKMSKM